MPARKTGTTAAAGTSQNGAGIVPVTALLGIRDSFNSAGTGTTEEQRDCTVHYSSYSVRRPYRVVSAGRMQWVTAGRDRGRIWGHTRALRHGRATGVRMIGGTAL